MPPSHRTPRVESVIIEVVNGREYWADRVIEGKRKLRQRIIFRGHVEHDSATYRPDQLGAMDSMAHLILWQLVTAGWPGQSPLEPTSPRGRGS
jgi:hypothetical protein